jgi:hypothetical protein
MTCSTCRYWTRGDPRSDTSRTGNMGMCTVLMSHGEGVLQTEPQQPVLGAASNAALPTAGREPAVRLGNQGRGKRDHDDRMDSHGRGSPR